MCTPKKIVYFAYCVNMLSNRMECCVHMSVKRKGIAKLTDHKFVFGQYSKVWEGCLATLVPCKGEVAWGCLWELDEGHKHMLDSLQGVGQGVYNPLKINVCPVKGRGMLEALTYKLVKEPHPPTMKFGKPLKKFRPSKIYMDELIEGADEASLPVNYRKWLRGIPHNGYTGSVLPRFDDEHD